MADPSDSEALTEEDKTTDMSAPAIVGSGAKHYPEDYVSDENERLINEGTKEPEIDIISLPDEDHVADEKLKTTNMQTMMHLLKGNIGTGILALPSAIKNAGLWTGLGGILFIGLVAVHCMHILVNCSHYFCRKTRAKSLDYGEVVEEAFKHGPVRLQKLSSAAKMTVNIFLVMTQLGFCIVYILFVADNLRQVIGSYTDFCPSVRLWQLFVFFALIPYVFVRNLKHLAPFSTIANILMSVGLIVILQYCVRDLEHTKARPAFTSWDKLPLYFGTAIYAFEGIGVILPIENRMKEPEHFGGLTGVMNTGMVIVTAMYSAIGFYGYLKVGDSIQGSITLNLPHDHWIYVATKLVIVLSIFISYGIQFYVPIHIMWPAVRARLSSGTARRYGEYLFRILFLVITFLLSIAIPQLDLVISLVGALASSTLALVFPPLLEIIVLWPNGFGRCNWKIFKDILICLFGMTGFVLGTTTTVMQIIKNASKDTTAECHM